MRELNKTEMTGLKNDLQELMAGKIKCIDAPVIINELDSSRAVHRPAESIAPNMHAWL